MNFGRTQTAEQTPFTGAGFVSENAQDAILEISAISGFVPDYIDSTVTVPLHRQMILSQTLTIVIGGNLIINGQVRIL